VPVRTWPALGLVAAAVLLVLVLIVVLSAPPRTEVAASPTIALASGTAAASAVVVPSPTASSASTSALSASVPVRPAPGGTGWSRGVYVAVDPQTGPTLPSIRLISVTRALQRDEVHNEISWGLAPLGPWSPDGTAVVAAAAQSFVIWPDSLTKLPTSTSTTTMAVLMWTWLDAGTVAAVVPVANDGMDLVRADAHTGQVLKRDAIIAWPFGSTVSPKGDWIAFSTNAADAPNYEAVTASTTERVSSGRRTTPAGWLPDGRFVFVREGTADSTVEVRDPARADAAVLGRFSFSIEVLAQPSSPVIVVHDPRIDKNQLWTLRGTEQRAVPLQYAFYGQVRLESISHDGRTASFTMPAMPGVGVRTGFIDLDTGGVTFICDGGCLGLVIN